MSYNIVEYYFEIIPIIIPIEINSAIHYRRTDQSYEVAKLIEIYVIKVHHVDHQDMDANTNQNFEETQVRNIDICC